ncbi:MAG: hypothetical protein P1V51_15050 [Deltaproteobacteria bacterium]|nr:hypothetical protein [Deltaproteobacteria bacterium]
MRHLPKIPTLALTLLALLALPAAARAQPGPPPGMDPEELGPPGAERETRERIRTMRAVALANHLNLDEKEALRMNAIMRRFDDEREQVRLGIRSHFEVLEQASRAGKGEKVDAKKIDAALDGVARGQERMAQLIREEFDALSKDLSPVDRARLAIFLREFPKEVRKAMRRQRGKHGMRGGGGGGPDFAPLEAGGAW